MPTTDEIIEFVKENTGYDNIASDTDIFGVGITGDDFHELIEDFAKTYSVDMKNYRWYFHANEEGGDLVGEIFFPPPYKRVERIPVTPSLLTEFANSGKWTIKYPKHQIPKKRYDFLINNILLAAFIVFAIMVVLKKS